MISRNRSWLAGLAVLGAVFVFATTFTVAVPRAQVLVPSLLQSFLGGSTTFSNLTGSLTDSSTNNSGTTQSTFSSVNTVTIPASGFNANTRGLMCDAWGVTTANANAKDFRILVGAQAAVASVTSNTLSAKAYWVHFALLRTGASTQIPGGHWDFDSPSNATFSGTAQGAALTSTDTASIAVAVQCQNTAAAAGCATGNGLTCAYVQ